jgi:hypothetical protein
MHEECVFHVEVPQQGHFRVVMLQPLDVYDNATGCLMLRRLTARVLNESDEVVFDVCTIAPPLQDTVSPLRVVAEAKYRLQIGAWVRGKAYEV